MWLRRLFRRRRKPPPLDPSALDRLEELIARVITLVPQAVSAPQPTAEPASQPEPPAEPASEPPAAEPPTSAHVLLLPGYTLEARRGAVPACGSSVEYEGRAYAVLRHGPSPLPGDERRCAFLELR